MDVTSELMALLPLLHKGNCRRGRLRQSEGAPSRESDASKTHLHTFHISTVWPLIFFGTNEESGVRVSLKMTSDMYLSYLTQMLLPEPHLA